MLRIAVQAADFAPGEALDALAALGGGGIGCFLGVVRPPVACLTLEHYPGMTEAAMRRIAEAAVARFDLLGCVVIHRVGRLAPGERIVLAAAAAAHRGAALEATAFLIDWLKTDAPFWKKERLEGGEERWVEARAADVAARKGWGV